MWKLYNLAMSLATNPKHTLWIAPLLILAEAGLCSLIIRFIRYTEIDYWTYLEQVHKFLQNDERNYAKITGPSGPLVYPAMHVWIYSVFYYFTVELNESGNIDFFAIKKAQVGFAGLYLATLAIVFACYRRANAPPWLLIPLVLSKRLHSIFLLRLFNDGWATFFLWLTIYAMQRKYWRVSAVVWSLGVGVKMSILLSAPALAIVLVQAIGLMDAVFMGIVSIAVQILIAVPFLETSKGGDIMAYLHSAFEFSRVFMFKWTVNWRFVGEQTFLSKDFTRGLLVLHVGLLLTFVHTKWVRISSSGIPQFVRKCLRRIPGSERAMIEKLVTPTFVMDTMLGAMVIGLMCARTLHYQFYAYIGWATPYLLWRGTGSMVLTLGIWAAQEWSWLVFPSTTISSLVVVGCLALQVVCALVSQPVDSSQTPEAAFDKMEETVGMYNGDKKVKLGSSGSDA